MTATLRPPPSKLASMTRKGLNMANNVKYETILSTFDGKMTLLQWLKKVEERLGRTPTAEEFADAMEEETSARIAEDEALAEGVAENARAIASLDIPRKQATFAPIVDALTNINGRVLSSYEKYATTIEGYEVICITKDMMDLDEASARAYMQYMCGSDYLPVFDYEKPANTYFIDSNLTIWKPQYGEFGLRYGIILFKVAQLPTSGGTQLYKHEISVESSDVEVYCSFFVVSTRSEQYNYLYEVVDDFRAGKITFGYLSDNYGNILSIKNDAGTYRFVTLAYAFDDYDSTTNIANVSYDFDSHSIGTFNDSVTAL